MKIYECCGIESITKKVYCHQCGKEIVNVRDVADRGTIYSYTVIHVAPAEYAHLAPYTVALIELEGTTAKLTARLSEEVVIGDKVVLEEEVDGAYVFKRENAVQI